MRVANLAAHYIFTYYKGVDNMITKKILVKRAQQLSKDIEQEEFSLKKIDHVIEKGRIECILGIHNL